MTQEPVQEETSETGSVRVTRVVKQPVKAVWDVLMTPAGEAALLGEGGELGNKGDSWKAVDGTCGVTRSFHPLEQIRFSWHENEDAPATLVDFQLHKVDDSSTELSLEHLNLPAGSDYAKLKKRWDDTLQRIDEDAL